MPGQQRGWGASLHWKVLPNKGQEHWILIKARNRNVFLWPYQLDYRDTTELKATHGRKEELEAVTKSDDDVTWVQGTSLIHAHDPSETFVGYDRCRVEKAHFGYHLSTQLAGLSRQRHSWSQAHWAGKVPVEIDHIQTNWYFAVRREHV